MVKREVRQDSYFPALDGLRGVMAMGVIVAHVNLAWFPGAPIMMDIFFVISGFLITSILLRGIEKTGSVALLSFWKRRLLRLYPALLVVVLSSLFVAWWCVDDITPVAKDAVASIFYYSNWTKIYDYVYPSMFGHTWSLSVEEQFYLLWPVLFSLALAARLRSVHILVLLALLAGAAMLWRYYLISQEVPWSRLYYALETRMDAFVVGGILALGFGALRERAVRGEWHAFLSLCALALLLLVVLGRPREIAYFFWQQSLALLLSAAVILLLTSPRDSFLKRLFCSRWCVFLGERCYSLYLWHWPIIWLLLVETEATKITILLIAIPLTLLLSSLTYAFVEAPFLSRMSRVRRIESDAALPSSR